MISATVASVDLAFTQGFAPTSLATIRIAILVIEAPLGGVLDLNKESRKSADALTAASANYVEPNSVSHYDFVGGRKPGAPAIFAEEDQDFVAICSEGGLARAARHAVLAKLITDFLNANFSDTDDQSAR